MLPVALLQWLLCGSKGAPFLSSKYIAHAPECNACIQLVSIYFRSPPPSLVSRPRLPSPFYRFFFAKRVVGRQLFRALRLTAHCAVATLTVATGMLYVINKQETRIQIPNTKHKKRPFSVLFLLPSLILPSASACSRSLAFQKRRLETRRERAR